MLILRIWLSHACLSWLAKISDRRNPSRATLHFAHCEISKLSNLSLARSFLRDSKSNYANYHAARSQVRGCDCIRPFQGRFPRAKPSLTRLAFHAARTHTTSLWSRGWRRRWKKESPLVSRCAALTREPTSAPGLDFVTTPTLWGRRVRRERIFRVVVGRRGMLFHRHPLELPVSGIRNFGSRGGMDEGGRGGGSGAEAVIREKSVGEKF